MRWFSKKSTKAWMIMPTVLLFAVFVIVPVIMAFYYSITNFTGIGQPKMTGLSNYRTLFKDPVFYVALKNTCIILGLSTIFIVLCSFGLALLLNRKAKGIKLMQSLCFVPNIISPILIGLIWVFILDPKIGLVNAVLRMLGSELQPAWIGGGVLTPYCVAFIFLWQTVGYNATIFVAGLRMVPEDLYEAAKIDGAGSWQRLVYITCPMIKQTIVIVMLLIVTGSIKIFEIVYQLTGGGPNHLSDTLVTYMYFSTFTSSKYGYGMSIASVTFLISAVFAVIYLKITKERIGGED